MKNKIDKKYMELAIQEARKNFRDLTGGPFGACIVKGNKVVSVARNQVLKTDATAHAEVMAIRKAAKKLKTYNLSGCVIYSTTEPCPMCFSAIHWARINTIIYGTTIADVNCRGFNELAISAVRLKKLGASPVKIVKAYRKECLSLLQEWDKLPSKKTY